MALPNEREPIEAALAAIGEARNILLVCHINPDGDTLGSMIALALGLEGHPDKAVTLLSADGVPAVYDFLPLVDRVLTTTERRDFDLAIVLDAGDLTRVGRARAAAESAPRLIDIDHHVTANAFGDIRLLDGTAAATGEIVYDLLAALGAPLTLPIAEALLCALLTDTGSFRFLNVTPRTLHIAANLVAAGASPDRIAEQVFENKPFAAQKLLGRALDALQLSPDGRIAWTHLTQADFSALGGTDEDTEGVVSAVRAVRGVDAALFLREMPSGRLRVSLRSRDPFDVSKVAQHFGGGGHRLASGCTLDGPLEEAEARLIAEVERQLRAHPGFG